MKRLLYHFTAEAHLGSILAAGCLTLTESNIGSPSPSMAPVGVHFGPDVVWLTDVAEPEDPFALGLDFAGADKTAVRVTVNVEAQPWEEFAAQHGIHPAWKAALEKGRSPERWFVCLHPIYMHDIVRIEGKRVVPAAG